MPAKFTRRNFLQGCSSAIAALAGARLTNVSFAQQNNSSDALVVIFLRGGWDALNVIPPMDGEDRGFYETARPDIKISDLLPLNDQFGMHPALAPLHELYQQEKMAVIHAVGLNYDTRSHFDAMEYIELGTPGARNTASGWITRHLQSQGVSSILPALSTSGAPSSLLNFTPTVNLNDPSDFSQWDNGLVASQQRALRQMYNGETLLHHAGLRTLDSLSIVSPLVEEEYQPANGASYHDDELSQQLKTVARMIKLDTGLRVATVDYGGWDTHEYETDGNGGYIAELLGNLASGLSNFYLDLDSGYTDRLSVVVISEFGRRLVQNEAYGTDHGHGSVMFTLGGGVNGGQVYGAWPGLHNDQLYDHADLAITTDYRQVLSELLARRLGNTEMGTVFPGYRATGDLGIYRAS
ncbi:MAG TPA: DUF1501 domain-containing protein [Anaerolineales bacterium]|nr:DUF1501 domain-containing protein [Anaerolineales bacterium]